MKISLQRLGDNPADHDGTFSGFYPATKADVNGLRPDVDPYQADQKPAGEDQGESKAWKIYPEPPPPHWHWKGAGLPEGEGGEGYDESGRAADGHVKGVPVDTFAEEKAKNRGTNGSEGFNMDDCEIPGADGREWEFEMDEAGVYQVYDKPGMKGKPIPVRLMLFSANQIAQTPAAEKKPLFRNVTLREYYTDLDYVLNVCSDGPAKSFAFRRLKYLQSKWSLYCLLNEYQEIADMKVCQLRDATQSRPLTIGDPYRLFLIGRQNLRSVSRLPLMRTCLQRLLQRP
jgi:AMP deaminase